MSALQPLFTYLVQHKQGIITFFRILYLVIFALLGLAFYFNQKMMYVVEMYMAGIWAGRIAIILFIIVIVPGMLRRFGINWQIKNIIMLFRRQVGVLVYSFVFAHFALFYLIPTLTSRIPFKPITIPFQVMGMSALYLLTVMFLTSNDWSVRKLGKWWTWIHRAIYIVAWFIFFHVFLQGKESWSIVIGIAALAETISLIYFYLIPKRPAVPPPQPPAQLS